MRLGLAVGPAALQRRAEDAVVLLAEPVGGVLAVDLAGGGEQQDLRAVLVRLLEDDLGAADVGGQALQRLLDDELDTRRRRPGGRRGRPADDVVDEVGVEDRCPSTNSKSGCASVLDVRRAEPVDRLSRTMTASPRGEQGSARWEPMKPAPPVTADFMVPPISTGVSRAGRAAAHRYRGRWCRGRSRPRPTTSVRMPRARCAGPRDRRRTRGGPGLAHDGAVAEGEVVEVRIMEGDDRAGGGRRSMISRAGDSRRSSTSGL